MSNNEKEQSTTNSVPKLYWIRKGQIAAAESGDDTTSKAGDSVFADHQLCLLLDTDLISSSAESVKSQDRSSVSSELSGPALYQYLRQQQSVNFLKDSHDFKETSMDMNSDANEENSLNGALLNETVRSYGYNRYI